ncbi:MAG TPA: excinuclease ABC subunit A [Stellaceae bacterium]|nr:excinuclease ABC subunit A [Stellaceae bacterium]
MHRSLAGLLILSATFFSQHALARDTEYHLKIEEAMRDPNYRKLGKDVVFFFGTENTPAIDQSFGEFVTNKKTNSFSRSDLDACRWVMLSALLELRERTLEMGGDAVVNIVSYYKKNVVASKTDYECHAGDVIAGVTLKGDVVKLKN